MFYNSLMNLLSTLAEYSINFAVVQLAYISETYAAYHKGEVGRM
jgi:hypothetical protein